MSTGNTFSPFRISRADRERLDRNEAFKAVREHLRRQEQGMDAPSFCSCHRHSCSDEEQEIFRLHRDIIHTIFLPLFLLHNQVSRLAANVLPSHRGAEPERAFRGEARSAYTWLDCILREEHDWYLTERCPACIVQHVLHSEPTIRFVAAWTCSMPKDAYLTPTFGSRHWKQPSGRIRFGGDDFWPDIEYRACALTDGVKQLVLQCLELRTALDRKSLQSPSLYNTAMHYPSPTAVKTSNCVQKHSAMTNEESTQLSKIAANRSMQSCWNDRPQRFHTRRHADARRRSITS
ncbi:uncharacterized protein ATNIH1004_007852 [Aspergillus tanneri]|uniref:Uncharacterized protein n=1 Tax=Aspergillus tanneri TaxID=1220188 RepID=A0A5M9MHF8_9EURO|nr:uncharacterized protein ATNIH1004_007852 [Aspergillus tanneri]KAA8646422.1 hypothetical protein ATNIH1004_007852 [Aspergillus tanneri]